VTLTQLDTLLNVRVPLDDAKRAVRLRVPPAVDLLTLILEPKVRTPERLAVLVPSELKRLMESVDGQPATIELARAFARDMVATVELLTARKRLLEVLSEEGAVYATCPHCLAWEAELSVVALTVALQAGPWPIIEDGAVLGVPALADPLPRGTRPATPPAAARIRFVPPSHVLGLPAEITGGVLGDADAEQDRLVREAWSRWAPPDDERAPGRTQWRHDVPGFRAMLRLAVALTSVEGTSEPISPALVERMPAVDFYFLDTLHYVTHNVDVGPQTHAAITCEKCGARFLPVL
jgi:hypothetical protein